MKMCIYLTMYLFNLFLYIITTQKTNYNLISCQSLENPYCRTINATERDTNPHDAQSRLPINNSLIADT